MSRTHVDHGDIVRFADEHVNLKRDDAKEMREQVQRLRERLEKFVDEHPDFELEKIMLSGSLAKGTALKTINDVDVAAYVSSNKAPKAMNDLIGWLAERLRKAFPNFKPEQVVPNEYSVKVSFAVSGLDVDVVPILYAGDPNGKGYLVSQETGEMLLTSIPMHLEFTRRRKEANKTHYAQIVRLLKFWIRHVKDDKADFRFKSFMVELLVAHLADNGLALSDYPEALAQVYAHIARDGFDTAIAFSDYYSPSLCKKTAHPMRIWDPVNHENNAAKLYTAEQKSAIIEAALDAGDAVDAALRATTKSETLRYWRKVFGPTFDV